jgi:mannose-6-phosphate isomerase
VLADCAEFRIRRVPLARGGRLAFAAGEQPRLLHAVRGRVQADPGAEIVGPGDNVLLPFAEAFEFSAVEDALLLVTDHFA